MRKESSKRDPSVSAVVVTYRPDLPQVAVLVKRLSEQVAHVVIVDNGSGDAVGKALREAAAAHATGAVQVLGFPENRGIAVAQNAGVVLARQRGSHFVLLMDQDSLPEEGMVAGLRASYERLLESGREVAAVGPWLQDAALPGFTPFVGRQGRWRPACRDADDGPFPVDYLLASGMLIPVSVLDRVGGMEDRLFIDYVDVQWCMRASSLGFESYGVCGARMRHCLGDKPARFLWRRFPMRSPLRNYYYFRNAILMYRSRWPGLAWKFRDAARVAAQAVVFVLVGDQKWQRIRLTMRGVIDGIRDRGGPFQGR